MNAPASVTADVCSLDQGVELSPEAHGAGPSLDAVAPVRPRRGRKRQKVLAVLVIVVALGFLLAKGLANAMDYYLTAKQAVAQKAVLGDKDFRVQGDVMPGVRRAGAVLDFRITSGRVDVDVVSKGTPPQLFKVGLPVVLDGHWQGNFFMSDQIMVQHSSNYVEAPKAKKPPHPRSDP